jgi:hypothetical protein
MVPRDSHRSPAAKIPGTMPARPAIMTTRVRQPKNRASSSRMDRTELEAVLSTLDGWLVVAGIVVAVGVVATLLLGYIRFQRSDQLARILAEENLSRTQAIESARRDADEANRVAESERLARIKIEERLADRRLTLEQQASIVQKLEPLGQKDVELIVMGSPEPMQIGDAIFDVLERAGWRVPWRRGELSRPIRGMLVEVAPGSDETEIAAATALVEALKNENLQVEGPLPMDPSARIGSWATSDADIIPAITLTIGAK